MSRRSKLKRDARQAKSRMRDRQCNTNVSNVGGLFAIGGIYNRSESIQPLNCGQVQDIKLAARLAFDNMIRGTSTENDWGMIAGSINTALILAEQGYGIEHEDVFIRAQEALMRSHIRGTQKHVWRFDGTGLQDIETALELHEQQCDLVTQGDIIAALNEVARRIDTGNTFQIEPIAA